jgi:hypothetical protein
MSTPVSFAEIHSTCVVVDDPSATALAIVKVLRLSASQREALFSLVLDECERWERSRVRAVERVALPPGVAQGSSRMGVPADRVEYKRLMRETFPLPKGVRVEWGLATVEQHRAKIEMMDRFIAGNVAKRQRHVDAIEMIVAAGVSCLDEIAEVAA